MNDTLTKATKSKPAERPRAHLCCFADCRVICVTEPYCWKHRRPELAGEWAIAEQVKSELNQQQPKDHSTDTKGKA